MAVKRFDQTAIGAKPVVVAYKEQGQDGFVITVFMTSKIDKLLKRGIQRATDSETDGRFVYHYDGNELVGVTVLHAKSSARGRRRLVRIE
ncbi:hypothetical protein [Candidatus Nitrospira nitrificans]|uniref:Uncharacterized protein n=1 Tax=Candidatus Nitrospira nitrificans TaxID=1742973 RepID=A0A0S4LEZ7_9BACT|nr:hypothetical protein [Candidatus Nitrospira nitrificans]CUS35160.1 hypothetical protein COMA2_20117 [Candidatus Nitrospira nitrificans]